MPRIPNRDKSVPQYATRNASGRHMRTLTISCGGGLALLSSAHHNSPACGPFWITPTAARDVARRSRPITSETTAATPTATTMTTIRAPTSATSASVRSLMLLMCWICLRYTLYFTLMIVATLPLTHGAHAHRQHTDMYSVVKRPNIMYNQVHYITHRFIPIIVVS